MLNFGYTEIISWTQEIIPLFISLFSLDLSPFSLTKEKVRIII